MSSNFDFLEKIDPEIFHLAKTSEKLFRDEYFEQCITQTRKLAERILRSILGNSATVEDSFDDMLYKLKTVSKNSMREQEFISDMYFLKKQGNLATHGAKIENCGEVALDCLEHAFEACINFAYSKTNNDTLNRLIFDEKLLVLGEKNTNLQAQYRTELERNENQSDDDEEFLNDIDEENNENFSKNRKKTAKSLQKSKKSSDFSQKNKKNSKKHKKYGENFQKINAAHSKNLFHKIMIVSIIFCLSVFVVLYLIVKLPQFAENSFYFKNFKNETKNIESKQFVHKKNLQRQTDYNSNDYSVTKNFSI